MKVLYANPIFLDYRLPFYEKLNELFKGEFYIMYSTNRYLNRYEHLLEEIPKVMGENAIPFNNELLFNTYERSFKKYNIEKGKRIPFTHGLIRKIKRINPDILITEGFYQWTPLIILYSIFFRKHVFMGYERTPHTERNTGFLKKIHRKITNKFISGYLVNVSETTKYLISLGINPNKIFIGGMSADGKGISDKIKLLSAKDIATFRSQYQKNEGLLYLFSGRITEAKGVGYLLIAWNKHIEKHPKDVLVLIGYGDMYEHYFKKYSDVSSIYLLGKIDYHIIYKYYAIADVFILPTLQDNWSLVVPEAMACGLPIATSIYNGCYPELVKEDVNGITFDTYNQSSLLHALDYFHHKDLKELGQNSIELEKPFNTENCAQREYEAILDVINRRK